MSILPASAPSLAWVRRLQVFGAAIALAGCSALPRNGVPPELAGVATVPNMPEVRVWDRNPSHLRSVQALDG